MSEIKPITLPYGENTATFDDQLSQEGQSTPAEWLNKETGIRAGFQSLTQLVFRRPQSQATKVSIKMLLPVLDADGKVDHQNAIFADIVISDSATLEEREQMVDYLRNLFGSEAGGTTLETNWGSLGTVHGHLAAIHAANYVAKKFPYPDAATIAAMEADVNVGTALVNDMLNTYGTTTVEPGGDTPMSEAVRDLSPAN